MSDEKLYKIDRFLGINQTADSETELKMGEASKIENFTITDGYNLKRRPGVRVRERLSSGKILGLYCGHANGVPWHCNVTRNGEKAEFFVEYKTEQGETESSSLYLFDVSTVHPIKVFYMGDSLWMVGKDAHANQPKVQAMRFADGEPTFGECSIYVPLRLSGCDPSGGGAEKERQNILTDSVRLQYSADGQATAYVLPEYVEDVLSVSVDNEPAQGTYDEKKHTYTFPKAPEKGVNNVEFLCQYQDEDVALAREKFFQMKHAEAYNGDTDTRLFFYGDGTNICYYTGIPAFGSGFYIPAGNELAADFSASAITAMVRHYSKLICFQEDGASSISYAPVTLADGTVTAGFYIRPLSREIGNQMDGQICTVNNYPRSLFGGTLYEWRSASNFAGDERYTKAVSGKVRNYLKKADERKVVTCQNSTEKTYYMFLNDNEGTVLVNRYELDVWTAYKGDVFKNVSFAACLDGEVTFANENVVFAFDESENYDAPVEENGQNQQIFAVWQSGYMDFNAPSRRKYSSRIWLSLLPEAASYIDVTVQTDKRSDYLSKNAGYALFGFGSVDFSNMSFLTWHAPQIRRIQMKVKKFVYYKLIFQISKPGSRATVLGYDQQVRFSSEVK